MRIIEPARVWQGHPATKPWLLGEKAIRKPVVACPREGSTQVGITERRDWKQSVEQRHVVGACAKCVAGQRDRISVRHPNRWVVRQRRMGRIGNGLPAFDAAQFYRLAPIGLHVGGKIARQRQTRMHIGIDHATVSGEIRCHDPPCKRVVQSSRSAWEADLPHPTEACLAAPSSRSKPPSPSAARRGGIRTGCDPRIAASRPLEGPPFARGPIRLVGSRIFNP